MRRALVLEFECLPTFVLGAYGCLPARTPAFDRLAAASLCFERCFTAEPAEVWRRQALQALSEAGLQVDFSRADVREQQLASAECVRQSSESENAATRPLSGVIWLHDPGLPVTEARQCLVRTTEGLQRMDRLLASLLDGLQQQGHDDDWLIIVCSSSGVFLSEDSAPTVRSQHPLREGSLHVPLMIWTRETARQSGSRIQDVIHTGCIAATIVDWMQPAHGTTDRAVSLLRAIHNETGLDQTPVICRGHEGEWAVVTRDYLCVARFPRHRATSAGSTGQAVSKLREHPETDTQPEVCLFLKPDDLWDTLDVSKQFPEERERLVDLLQQAAGIETTASDSPRTAMSD